MSVSWEKIEKAILATLTKDEIPTSAVYLDHEIVEAGTSFEVDGKSIKMPFRGVIGFVDLEPMVNWSHRCRYLLTGLDGEEIVTVDAGFPPFLQAPSSSLTLIWQGTEVQNWAIALQ